MIRRLGYAGIALGVNATTTRSCRLKNASPTNLRELIQANLSGLERVLQYNVGLDIRLFRVSSQIVPFASHPVNVLGWWEENAETLQRLGDYVMAEGLRLSMHPGQYTVLSSPRPEVVDAALNDLLYHTRFLDAMGLGPEHKIVIHGGGTYGDRAAAQERFVTVYRRLPANIRSRLVIENDERSYRAQDVLAISHHVGIPVVFDALHDQVLPSPDYAGRPKLMKACFETWTLPDGPPKTHFSSQDPTRQCGAHAAWIDPRAFMAFSGDTDGYSVDCMLEAKQKDLALLALRRDLGEVAGTLPTETAPPQASAQARVVGQ